MNVRTSSVAIAAAFALSLTALAGCSRQPAAETPPLAGARLGGPFALVDQDGRTATDKSFAGRYRAVYFGYSFCPDVCPTTLQVLMQGYRSFASASPGAAARLAPVFITVDPERDTPAVLKSYVAAFGKPLVGLTGTPDAIAAAAKAYGVYYHKQATAAGASGYLVDHSSQVILFGPDGQPIALVPTDQGAKAVADTFAEWVH
ncbi:SCO family protein [Sphingomonas sp. PR090111-T3T-6A]|uniref:SCO family protein n=1 Tax=Sphingomonas sp. PR090111-T3T-6A TaxID=685778 RepID=UPI0003759FE9|nr:SCO family protein [Sphingomonas sp. PR090111-T3T-6A]